MKKLAQTIIENLEILLTPSIWVRPYTYSALWDAKLNHLMDYGEFVIIDTFEATIGGVKVWIANHPYASFMPSSSFIHPKRSTSLKAMKKLKADYLAQQKLG